VAPASDGLFADLAQGSRYGHELYDTDGSLGIAGDISYSGIKIGTKSQFVVLSLADTRVIYLPIAEFGATGALAAGDVVTGLAYEKTTVRVDTRSRNGPPPRGDGQAVAQLELRQGSNSVLLTQANCLEMATALGRILGLPELREAEDERE
jgi:hypothetical protein